MKKIAIAMEMLVTAIDLFVAGKSYVSSLHLAGAAEELLGSYVKQIVGQHALDEDIEATSNIHKFLFSENAEKTREMILEPKNSAKHRGYQNEDEYPYEVKKEAQELLDRAIKNYYLLLNNGILKSGELEKIEKYEKCIRIHN